MLRNIQKFSQYSIVFFTGLFLHELIEWVTPFSSNLTLDIGYLVVSFILGFCSLSYIRISIKNKIALILVVLWGLVFLNGEAFLYFLIKHFDWGWLLVYIGAFLTGMTNELFVKKKGWPVYVSLFIIGLLFNTLVNNNTLFKVFLIVTLMLYALGSNHPRVLLPIILLMLVFPFFFNDPIKRSNQLIARQKKYADKVVFTDFSRQNKVDVTSWRGNYWYYINNQNRLSSLDEYLYHEPFVHPAMHINSVKVSKALVLGGEMGGVVRELVKYVEIDNIDVIPLDIELLKKFKEKELLKKIGGKSWYDSRVDIIDQEVFKFLENEVSEYDAIFIDLPDPTNLLYNQFYTLEFYELCRKSLKQNGIMVTQAGSPYFATKAFYSIIKTIDKAGFKSIPYHNQILTLGEWGWVIGKKSNVEIDQVNFSRIDQLSVKWINQNAMDLMLSFGKIRVDTTGIRINRIKEPITFQYYQAGNWAFK